MEDRVNPPRRSLCIVSCDPLQCSELVLALQADVEPEDVTLPYLFLLGPASRGISRQRLDVRV